MCPSFDKKNQTITKLSQVPKPSSINRQVLEWEEYRRPELQYSIKYRLNIKQRLKHPQTVTRASFWLQDCCFLKIICGLNRDLNPGPPAPEAGIIPLDHWAYPCIRVVYTVLTCTKNASNASVVNPREEYIHNIFGLLHLSLLLFPY